MLSILIVAGIAVSVAIGYKTKFNTGLFAIVFAYLIGCFGLGMSTKDVINGWPVSTMFVIFSVSLFYNFAMVNGTLEKTAGYLLYACRRFPGLLPFALYLAAALIAALGAGFFTVLAFMAPIALLICEEAKMDKLVGAVAVNCGALSGAVALAGLKNSQGNAQKQTKGSTYKLSKELVRRFREKNQTVICRELKGLETGQVLRSCDGCIRDAARLAEELLFGEEE